MLKEIEVEVYGTTNIKEEGLSPAQEIIGDLSKYALFNRGFFNKELSIEQNNWEGCVLSNNSRINISETKKEGNLYDVMVLFAYVKETPEDELEQVRKVFRRRNLEKKVR